MAEKCLVLSCKGLGDGIIAMILSHNLFLNQYEVITFQEGNLDHLQRWFPHLPIRKIPKGYAPEDALKDFDQLYVFHDTSNSFTLELIEEGKAKYPEKIKVLNPCISRTVGNEPYHKDACFNRKISIVDNIENFCRNILKLEIVTKENGIKCPSSLVTRKNKRRVVIHPTSAKPGRSWTKEKFLDLYDTLLKLQFEPCFVMSKKEKESWASGVREDVIIKGFDTFDDLAAFVCESGYFIGNDSGVGHLASSLGLPVLCISRSQRTSQLWAPNWGKVKVVYPSNLIPNIKGFRFRDKKWKYFLSKRKVLKNFLKLVDSESI